MENSLKNIMKEKFPEQDWEVLSKMPEAALIELARVIGHINYMKESELVNKLKSFRLDAEGDVECLRERLRNSYMKIIPACIDVSLCPGLLPFYVVIDFEATCGEVNPPNFRHEIIEFPALLINTKKQEIIDCFHMYCKPQINPKITEFCTELTGITQEQVDSAETFDKVLEHFQNWLIKHNLGKRYKFAIVTDGPWDMSRFFYSQCHYLNIKVPKWSTKWVNLRKTFSRFYHCERISLKNMLEFLQMEFIGRPHCGLDDAKNISRILLRLIYDGANVQVNERVTESRKPKVKNEKKGEFRCNCKGNLNTGMEKLRIEANYTAVYSTGKVPAYKAARRERQVAEVQTARKMFYTHDSDNNDCEIKPKSNGTESRKVKKEF